jgi:CHAD domain-containing protein
MLTNVNESEWSAIVILHTWEYDKPQKGARDFVVNSSSKMVKQLKSYAKKRFKNLKQDLKSYGRLQDPEVLHRIRVEIKKIKVLINLIDFSVKNFKGHQHFIPLRTIFRKAGEIRQPEVLYKLLLLYQIGNVSDAQIPKSKVMDRLSKAFQKKASTYIEAVNEQEKKIKKYYSKVSKTEAEKYLKKRKRELEHLLYRDFNKKELHKARKICKEIVYLPTGKAGLHWIDNSKEPDPFYTEVENRIGQWHDKQALLPILKKKKAVDEVTKLMAASKEDMINLKELVVHYFDNP